MSYIRYKIEKQQVSYDSGVTWVDTSVTRNGDYAGTYSTLPECETGGDTSYSGQYFTIESAVDNNVVAFVSHNSRTISASTDGGNTWSGYTASSNSSPTIATLNMGQKVLIKGLNSVYYDDTGTGGRYISNFAVSGNYIVYGNIMSLVYGDSFATATTLTGDHNFASFFSGKNKLISAENLILGATVLTSYCYNAMFQSCTNLTAAPVLPATTLAEGCYNVMFADCTSLTTEPELPATTLADYCYSYMFNGCTSLVTAPELPATTLADYCYNNMFKNCTSLVTAPELPAETLVTSCYGYMFNGCSSLNSVTCLATDKSARFCTTNWLSGVAASGTFVKAANMTGWPTGTSGIPSGWTVQNA